MSNKEISIHCIARTQIDRSSYRAWLDAMHGAAKQCYKAFIVGANPNVTRVRDSWSSYFDNILSSGHGSVLEHATFSFAIEGVTRVFTAEMNRHRAGWAISERPLRYVSFSENIDYWLPPSIRENKEICEVFEVAFKQAAENYNKILTLSDTGNTDFHTKKLITSLARRVVPMGVSTGGVWTGNVRALRHVMALRCSSAAEEEIAFVFNQIATMLVEMEPLLFGDFNKEKGCWEPKYPKV